MYLRGPSSQVVDGDEEVLGEGSDCDWCIESAGSVTAGVVEENSETLGLKNRSQGQHSGRVGSPAVRDDHCREPCRLNRTQSGGDTE